jgi:hypothetical protein
MCNYVCRHRGRKRRERREEREKGGDKANPDKSEQLVTLKEGFTGILCIILATFLFEII